MIYTEGPGSPPGLKPFVVSTRIGERTFDFTCAKRAAHRILKAVIPNCRISFDNILDRVTASDPSVTDYRWKRRRSVPTAGGIYSRRLSSSPPDMSLHVLRHFHWCAGCWPVSTA